MKAKPTRRLGVVATAILGSTVACGAGVAGYVAGQYAAPVLLAGFLKYAIGVVGIVWFFSLTVYNKLSDATDMAGLDYRQHRGLEVEISSRLHLFWMRALFLAIVALFLYAPSILAEAKLAIPSWVFGASFAALALALFSLRRLWQELEEIRELRSHIKEIERREAERAGLVKDLKGAAANTWEKDERLDGFRGTPSSD